MFSALRKLFNSITRTTGNPRQSMARGLMEAAQTRSAYNAREARELRRAAIKRLSVVR